MSSKRRFSVHHVGVILAVALSLAACDRQANLSATEHLERGRAAQAKGDFRSAAIDLKNGIQKEPNNAEARLALAEVYLAQEMGADAEKELRRARELGVGDEAIKPLLGRALLLQAKPAELLDEIQVSSATSNANSAKILALRGEALMLSGKAYEGCAMIAEAHNQDTQHVPAYWGLARCDAIKGDLAGARRRLDQALKIDPRNSESWELMGALLRETNDTEGAKAAYGKAVQANGYRLEPRVAQISIEIESGDFDSSQKHIKALREVAPRAAVADYVQGLLDFRRGQYARARDSIDRVLKALPDHQPSLLLSGAIAYSMGSFELAQSQLARFLRAQPGNAYARQLLAAAQLRRGQPGEARETLRPLLAQTPDDKTLRLAGEAALATGDAQAALAYVERAERMKPDEPQTLTQLGTSRLAVGQTERALADLERAAQLDVSGTAADLVLAMAHLNRSEYDKLIEVAATMEKKAPGSATPWNFRGAAYLGKQDFARAREAFERALKLEPGHAATTLNYAQLEIREGQPAKARKLLEKALEKDPKNVSVMIQLAGIARTAKQSQDYVRWLERAVAAAPGRIEAASLLADHYVARGDAQKALVIARNAQTLDQNNPQALDFLARIQLAAGQKENALASYERVAALQPRSAVAQHRLAIAQIANGREPAARASLVKAIELQPAYLPAREHLVALDLAAGRVAQAIATAKETQRVAPQLPAGFVQEGDARMVAKQYAAAATAYSLALQKDKSGLLLTKLHAAMQLSGQGERADILAADWLRQNPRDADMRAYWAATRVRAGRYPEAIAQYEILVKDDPNNAVLLNDLAWLYQQVRDPRAVSTAERALAIVPQSPTVKDTLGWILLEQGQVPRALELLRAAVAGAPDNGEIRYHYAAALAKSGDKVQARSELRETLRSGKGLRSKDAAERLLATL